MAPRVKGEKVCNRPCNKSSLPKDFVVTSRPDLSDYKPHSTTKIGVDRLVKMLDEIPESEFVSENVTDFLRRHPVSMASLDPYLRFQRPCYTRNLVASNEKFEVMLLCWNVGQQTAIHNHDGQSCWVYVQSGRLCFRNYRWLGCDRQARTANVEEVEHIPMAAEGSLSVIDEKDAIHRLGNDLMFDERAVSLHIYASPLKTCVVYDEDAGTCEDKSLSYHSVAGKWGEFKAADIRSVSVKTYD